MSASRELAERIRERFPEVPVEAGMGIDMPVLVVGREGLADVLRFLRDEAGYDMLADLSAVDWLPRQPRFDVHYHLLSLGTGARLRVKVGVPEEDPALPSAVGVWPGADWQEREVFDLMGIVFLGHPNLKRILMPDEWIGHPLRKDYPVGGVPVEYRIEPAYVGAERVSDRGRPSRGGVPPRLVRDRGRPSPWTWTGAPAADVRVPEPGPGHEEGSS